MCDKRKNPGICWPAETWKIRLDWLRISKNKYFQSWHYMLKSWNHYSSEETPSVTSTILKASAFGDSDGKKWLFKTE